jgi:hypothetical protein
MSKKPAPDVMPYNPETPTTSRQDFVAFLNTIGNVAADKVNPAFKSRYASLPEILDCVKAVAKDFNLAVHQTLSSSDGTVRVTTTILHADGTDFPGGSIAFKSDGLDPQKLASATTYLRRLCLKTAVGIETDLDDDGAAASRPTAPKAVQATAPAASSDIPGLMTLPPEDTAKAVAYCQRKGWIAEGQTLTDLPAPKLNAIHEQFPAFLAAIRK